MRRYEEIEKPQRRDQGDGSGGAQAMTCGCGRAISKRARACQSCAQRGGWLTSAVLERYPEESAREIAADLNTTEMAVYNTASRLRRNRPGSVGYRNGRES